MKFWRKTYFCVLILFLVVFNISICWIMYTTYQGMLGSEKEKALGEHYFIKQALENDMNDLASNNKLSDATIKNLMNFYSNYYSNKNVTFLLLRGDKETLFSNLEYKSTSDDSLLKITNGQNILLRETKRNKYILIAGVIDQSTDKFYLVYCYKLEITGLWNELKAIFICFSFGISIILAILLGLILHRLSGPLRQLLGYVNQIKNGAYDSRVKIRGKDEFAMLGSNFNEMSEKIGATVLQLNDDMERKQQFIDNLSHELRTPLTSIYGYAEYIQKAAISEKDKYEATKYIMEESKRLQYMANRLLDMTIRGQTDIIQNKINVEELFEHILKIVSPLSIEKSITININNQLSYIIGEPQLIESLLVNLLDNAIKASKRNQSIEILGFFRNKDAIIEIIDKGRGISKEDIKHITEPFYRTDKARSKLEGGAGLGLALCKQIMDMHQGRLEITSELNIGTTIFLVFTTF